MFLKNLRLCVFDILLQNLKFSIVDNTTNALIYFANVLKNIEYYMDLRAAILQLHDS